MGTPALTLASTRANNKAKKPGGSGVPGSSKSAQLDKILHRESQLPRVSSSIPAIAPAGEQAHMWQEPIARPALPLQRKLNIGSSSDPLESEADAMANRVMRMAEPSNGSSNSAAEPVLRRKCACEESGHSCASCENEKKEKLMRKATGPVASVEAPAVVHHVLRSPGQTLEPKYRAFFESRFGRDFSRVRVHTDGQAAESARAVNALAYTVGNRIVFGHGRYSPYTSEGRRLVAHELSHVVQQAAAGRLLQRKEDDERGVGNPNSVLDRAYAAADASRWEEVAGILKDSSRGEIRAWLYPFRNEPEKISFLYLGAIGNKAVGPDSNVALETRAIHLDFKFDEQKRRGNWGRAAEYLNGFNHDDVMRRLARFETKDVRALHDGAVQNTEIGPESGAAKFTAEELEHRAAKGDTTATLPPGETSQKLTVEQRKENCGQGHPESGLIFPLRMPKGLWRIDVAAISAHREGEFIRVSQPLNAVYANSYFKNETRTLPLQVFTGGIRIKPDQIVRVRLYDQEKDGQPIIRCVTGEQMLKISEATDTAVIVGIVDTALLAATVFVPGGGAAATRFAVGQIAANELGDLALQKKMVDAGIQDKVDWAGLAFDTILQLATLGFGGKLSKVVLSKLEFTEAGKFSRPVLAWAIQTAISGATFDFQALAHVVFDRIRGEKKEINYGDLIEQLALEFVKGALFHTILSSVEHEKETSGAHTSAVHVETGEPSHPAAVTPKTHVDTPAPVPRDAAPVKTTATADTAAQTPVTPAAPQKTVTVTEPAAKSSVNSATQEKASGLEQDTGPQQSRDVPHRELDLGPNHPSGLELGTGSQSTRDVPHHEFNLGSGGPSGLELGTGPQPTRDVPFQERDLGPASGQKLSVYRGSKPANQIPGVSRSKPTFGNASSEQAGTFRRSGTHFHELNAAEIDQGLRVDYDPVAGRPRSASYRVDADNLSQSAVTDRSFSADISVEGAQSKNSAYEGTGYDRGHLAQREAFKGDAAGERAVDLFTNVVPMKSELNQRGAWRAAEEQTVRWAKQYGSVNVTIEPVYDQNPPRLRDGTPIPKAMRRTVTKADGTVLQDVSILNK